MYWALLGILVLAFAVLASRYPRFAASLWAAFILLVVGGYLLQKKLLPDEVQISPEDVVFTAISIDRGYAGSWDLHARLHNQTLLAAVRELGLRIEVFNCPPWAQSVSLTECEFMGEVVKSIPLNVAPRESKDFEVNLIFPPDLRPDLSEQPELKRTLWAIALGFLIFQFPTCFATLSERSSRHWRYLMGTNGLRSRNQYHTRMLTHAFFLF